MAERSKYLECPHCGVEARSFAKWAKKNKSLGAVRRTRECSACGHSFYTLEVTVKTFDKVLNKADLVDDIFSAILSQGNLKEFIDDVEKATSRKKEVKKKPRRGPRKKIST